MLDLDQIDTTAVNAGSWLTVDVPPALDDGSPMRIKLLGVDSDVYIKAAADYRRTLAKHKLTVGDESPVGREADVLLYASVTLAWEGVTKGDAPWPCTRENVCRLYATQPWVIRQVRAFVVTDANFIQALPQTPETRPES